MRDTNEPQMQQEIAWSSGDRIMMAFITVITIAHLFTLDFLVQSETAKTNIQQFLMVLATVVFLRIMARYKKQIESFCPATPLAAKRANEQIKFTASSMNTLSGAAAGFFILSKIVSDRHAVGDGLSISIAAYGVLLIHQTARNMLKSLKDESATIEQGTRA